MVDDGVSDEVATAAVAWHLRLPAAKADAWLAFTAWLEADPAHARAYDSLSSADAELNDALTAADWSHLAPVAANDGASSRLRWIWGATGALAAAGLAAVMVPLFGSAPAARYVETAAGERRSVTLADGSRIDMNGATRVAIMEGKAREIALERGEAVFHVTHDAARPFVITAGDARLEDVGTVFNVTHADGQLSVEVAEGAVLFEPDRDRIMLTAGAALTRRDGGPARMSGIAVGDVAGWQGDRLVFRQAPIRSVAAALERSTGATITVAPTLADTPFTGSIGVQGTADRVLPRVAAVMGARAVRDGGRWTLVREDHADP